VTTQVKAFDVETFPITNGNLDPRVVCCSFSPGSVIGNAPLGVLEERLKQELESARHLVGHNVAYDLSCIAKTWPQLRPLIWRAYKQRRIHDTLIREKLLNLAAHGNIDTLAGRQVGYSLQAIAKDRLGVDLSDDKSSTIRVRYHELDGIPAASYPRDFYLYSQQDADITLRIFQSQEKSAAETGLCGVFASEWLHVNMAWCLYHSTIRGLKVDKAYTRFLWDETVEDSQLDNFPLLRSSGIITPACQGRPYKKNPNKFTKGSKEKVNVASALMPRVVQACKEAGIPVEETDTGRVSTSKQVIANLAPFDPVLEEYQRRQKLSKLVTTYFPAMVFPRDSEFLADTIHPQYDPLKRTGRISSRGNSARNKSPLYASVNIQQVDPRIRGCYVPREGYVFLSADYRALELCCLADTIYDLYGSSVLREQLNQGKDAHSYFGSVMTHKDYETFLAMEDIEPDYYVHWRNLAKVIGLSLPGGMGLKTMMKIARGRGVVLTENEAEDHRETWLDTYPNMNDYLAYEGDEERTYESPLGMIRAGCNYTQYCNGKALQTPGAEGMKLATMRLCEEMYNGGFLSGCHFVASIHDEVLMEVPDDEDKHIYAEMVKLIMVEEMKKILTSLNSRAIKVEAALMRRWDKKAAPAYDEAGQLTIWTR